MNEPVDLSGLDFAVDMMRRPSPESIAEQLAVVTIDRDIKAANLKTLVDMVLHYSEFAEQFVDGPPYDDAGKTADGMWKDVVALARGLKQ